MYKNICITNRKLVKGDFLAQLERVARECKIDWIVLREKDLCESDYEKLAIQVKKICDQYGVECFFHNHLELAQKYGVTGNHLSFQQLEVFQREKWEGLKVGCSVHSLREAVYAQSCGMDYLMISPIYETECKPGVEAKTPLFIAEIKNQIEIPVYALGGINRQNKDNCIRAGADGVCMMSAYMNQ